MNCYKVNYAGVWLSGPKGPEQSRSVKEGSFYVLAEDGAAAGQIATANVPPADGRDAEGNSIKVPADEVHIGHVQEVAKNVIQGREWSVHV